MEIVIHPIFIAWRIVSATYRFLMAAAICMLAGRFKFQTNFRPRCAISTSSASSIRRRVLAHARTGQTHRNDERSVAGNRDNYAALSWSTFFFFSCFPLPIDEFCRPIDLSTYRLILLLPRYSNQWKCRTGN